VAHEDERYFGFLVSDAARLMRTVFDRRMRELGLTRAQWLVLTRLSRRPGASQSELADMIEIEKAAAGRLVDRLEEKGWVERRADANDRRINRIHLTEQAEVLHDSIRPIARETVEVALSDLTPAERETLTDLMLRVKTSLQRSAEIFPSGGAGLEDGAMNDEALTIRALRARLAAQRTSVNRGDPSEAEDTAL